MDGDNHLTEHIQLQMFRGGVADAHRAGVLVAAEVVEGVLLEGGVGGDAVDDLGATAVELALLEEPVDVAVGAVDVAEAVEDVDGEGGVAEPGEAVVPVAGAADGLGEAGGRCGDDGAGAGEHHQVEDEEGADNLVAPEAVVVHVLH